MLDTATSHCHVWGEVVRCKQGSVRFQHQAPVGWSDLHAHSGHAAGTPFVLQLIRCVAAKHQLLAARLLWQLHNLSSMASFTRPGRRDFPYNHQS